VDDTPGRGAAGPRPAAKAHLSGLFRRYGLPGQMLADNGSPWGGSGADGYTALEVWLLTVCSVSLPQAINPIE
jgi:hypothetical protein